MAYIYMHTLQYFWLLIQERKETSKLLLIQQMNRSHKQLSNVSLKLTLAGFQVFYMVVN